jgi:DNA repair protein RecO (recombination protein O)
VTVRRVQLEPGFVLHQRAFRNTSQIIDCLTPHHGLVGLVARGSRRPKSRQRAILQPFVPLRLSWQMRGELGTLTGAEGSSHFSDLPPKGVLAGFYINELVLSLVPREQANEEAFSCYSQALVDLAADPLLSRGVRLFEYRLLVALGYAPNLDHEVDSGPPVEPDGSYRFETDRGPSRVQEPTAPDTFSGSDLLSLHRCELHDESSIGAAKRILSGALRSQLGDRQLKSAAVLRQIVE